MRRKQYGRAVLGAMYYGMNLKHNRCAAINFGCGRIEKWASKLGKTARKTALLSSLLAVTLLNRVLYEILT